MYSRSRTTAEPLLAMWGGDRPSALDVRRLSLFVAVVDHRGFTRAARALYISQPALSQAISELETALGLQLFHRLGREVHLTSAGENLLGPARAVLRQLDAACQIAAEAIGLSAGRLELSSLRSLAADPLPALLGQFVRAHPGVDVRLASPDGPLSLIEQVRDGDAEVGITDSAHGSIGLVSFPLETQRMVILFPPGYPAPQRPLSVTELADVPLVVTPSNTSSRNRLDQLLASHGLKAKIRIETPQREAVLPFVLSGVGAAVVPAGLARIGRASGAVSAGIEPELVRHLVVLHRSTALTPAAAAFVVLAQEHARVRTDEERFECRCTLKGSGGARRRPSSGGLI